MANPQKENGYTAIANELLEQILRLDCNGTQLKLLLAIIRHTYGYNRTKWEFSINYLAETLGVSKVTAKKEIKRLIDRNILLVYREASFKQGRLMGMNKDYEQWDSIDTQGKNHIPEEGNDCIPLEGKNRIPGEGNNCIPLEGKNRIPREGNNCTPIKRKNKEIEIKDKENIKDSNHDIQILFFIKKYTKNTILQQSLERFVLMRQNINCPVTGQELKLVLDELTKLGKTDEDKIRIIDQSVTKEWHGIFPVKGGLGNGYNAG